MLKANEIVRRSINLGVNVFGKEQDNIQHPENYIDINNTSDILDTPMGDNFMMLSYKYTTSSNIRTADIIYIMSILIEAPIINITRKKTVINTTVNGLDSSIFEVTSNGDYNISATFSFITNRTWKRKRDDFMEFLNVMNYGYELTINNPFLNTNFNIHKVILENYTVRPNKEFTNIIDVTLNLKYVADYKMFEEYIEEKIFKVQ